jgi:hypothetical protein
MRNKSLLLLSSVKSIAGKGGRVELYGKSL